MKTQHIALPSLQAASVAFFAARGAEARRVFCANANNEVVADVNCDGSQPAGAFFRIGSDVEVPSVGSAIDPATQKYDAADVIGRQNARFPPPEFISGGFGKRQLCESDDAKKKKKQPGPVAGGGSRSGGGRSGGRKSGGRSGGGRSGG
ncbi:Primase zinc finger [Colletotrichum higginsianum IMI 349063]|uniref:Primase zinc finger n=2 Tax=Colletotrichum higginsianum TaxID=80884 RepID=A0A1B7Y4R7_COLHI|nr:Primase zinc finger [Colletotrichum higginsianum IMI 349063]OBR06995.1 Primase zinc finger [Colletotrichum higginsianum IMI 349063]TIC92744.1 hypothetical protein CH35J_010012 [Colletotrichum higginsianum]GJC98876.1 primase zinc finger [Colletotrichum higginsianum]